MGSSRKWILLIILALVSASAVAGAWAAITGPQYTYCVNGFWFEGPAGLDGSRSSTIGRRGAVGRRHPTFIVSPLNETGIQSVVDRPHEECEAAGRAVWINEYETFAPGGGRDHNISVFVPSLESGISIYFRTHERDHGAGVSEHLDAWRCRRWARSVVGSLRCEP